MYWSLLDVTFTCPGCGAKVTDTVQTHFMGEVGSCSNYYRIGEMVPELEGCTVTLGPGHTRDEFIGKCDECSTFVDFGARIEGGIVVEVWPLPVNVP
jgi:hypothetical protein